MIIIKYRDTWWEQLSKLIWQSWRMWDWWLGREIRGRGECREGISRMSSEGQMIWNIKIDWKHHHSLLQGNHPIDEFMDSSWFGIWLTMTHTALRQHPTPHWVKSSIKSSFHLYLFFPWMSHCVSFYYSFFFLILSSDLSCLFQDGLLEFFWLIEEVMHYEDLRNVA